jgi:hypothetical protein
VSFVSHAVIHFPYRPECIYTVYQSPGRDEKGNPSSPGRCRCGSKLGDDETDTADDVVRRGFVRSKGKKLDREGRRERAEDEPTIVEFDKTEDEAGTATDGIEGPLVGAVRRKRVVVAIEDDDGPGSDHGIHCDNLLGVGADGEESLPVCALQGWAGAIFL